MRRSHVLPSPRFHPPADLHVLPSLLQLGMSMGFFIPASKQCAAASHFIVMTSLRGH